MLEISPKWEEPLNCIWLWQTKNDCTSVEVGGISQYALPYQNSSTLVRHCKCNVIILVYIFHLHKKLSGTERIIHGLSYAVIGRSLMSTEKSHDYQKKDERNLWSSPDKTFNYYWGSDNKQKRGCCKSGTFSEISKNSTIIFASQILKCTRKTLWK